MRISEKQVMDAITSVLMENRKVLRIGSSTPSSQPAPDMGMPPMQDPNMMAGQMGPAGGPGDPGALDPNMGMDMGGDMPSMDGAGQDDGAENQFDSNFDAGVDADEETDPKHYIQQLTGKLSQSLNSFNSEQGPDAGLCKYVASMIISAACKNLDDKAKKELIEKINSAASDDETDDEGTEDMGGEDMGGEEEMPQEPNMEQQPPMNESVLTKRQLTELVCGTEDQKRQDNLQPAKPKKNKPNIFSGKRFSGK